MRLRLINLSRMLHLAAMLLVFPNTTHAQAPRVSADEQAVNQVLTEYHTAVRVGDSVRATHLLAPDAWLLNVQARPYGRISAHGWRWWGRPISARGLTLHRRLISLDSADALVLETRPCFGARRGLLGRRAPQTALVVWMVSKQAGEWWIQSQTISIRSADLTIAGLRREVRREANRFYWRQALL